MIVLKNQVEASEKSLETLEEELQRQHRCAMLCYDIEDLMENVVDVHADLNRNVARWQAEVPKDVRLAEYAAEWNGLHLRIASLFEKTFQLIQGIEALGYYPQGKGEFLAAWRELRGTTCFSLERIEAASAQVRRGEMRPLGEVMNELWDTPVH